MPKANLSDTKVALTISVRIDAARSPVLSDLEIDVKDKDKTRRLTEGERNVFTWLLLHVNDETATAWPSIAQLIDGTGGKDRGARGALKTLAAAGLFTVESRGRAGRGGRDTNLYRFDPAKIQSLAKATREARKERDIHRNVACGAGLSNNKPAVDAGLVASNTVSGTGTNRHEQPIKPAPTADGTNREPTSKKTKKDPPASQQTWALFHRKNDEMHTSTGTQTPKKSLAHEAAAFYVDEYRRRFDMAPHMNWGGDVEHLKRLLAGRSLDDVKTIISEWLNNPPKFYADKGLSIQHLSKAAPEIIQRLARQKRSQPYSSERKKDNSGWKRSGDSGAEERNGTRMVNLAVTKLREAAGRNQGRFPEASAEIAKTAQKISALPGDSQSERLADLLCDIDESLPSKVWALLPEPDRNTIKETSLQATKMAKATGAAVERMTLAIRNRELRTLLDLPRLTA